jgi:hypothetical protein
LAKLKQFGFTEGIRITETPDKEAMEKWPEDRLALVGCVRRTTDKWHCKPAQEKLSA